MDMRKNRRISIMWVFVFFELNDFDSCEIFEENMMSDKIWLASSKEIEDCYCNYLLEYFPENEVKPLESIIRMLEEGFYQVLLIGDECGVKGAAFLVSCPNCDSLLLDYLFTVEEYRSCGVGTQLLRTIPDYANGKRILIETETLRSADGDAERNQRMRRNAFYERCGAKQRELITNIFGAEYNIWTIGTDKLELDDELDLAEEFRMLYQYMLPAEFYEREVMIPVLE